VFRLHIPPVKYADPWSLSYEDRLAMLRSGSPRIAYYYTQPDTSTFRYRVFNMIEALRIAEPDVSAAWFTAADARGATEAIAQADLVIIGRALYSRHVAAVVTRARAAGRRVLFDVDDFVFDSRYTHLIMETLDQNPDDDGLQWWFGHISRLGATLQLCDGAITTNEFLAERIRRFHDAPTYIVPNFLNHAQLELSARIVEAKRASRMLRDARIHVGYFSGTPTHNRDFAIVEPALLQLLEEEPKVVVRVVGFMDLSASLSAYRDRIEQFPLQDFLNLQRLIGEVELNIVPLQDNEFTNCKSELKYFEAGVVATPTVASPTYMLRRAIRHGENGFLATAPEWYATLREALDDLERLDSVAEAALDDALERYAPAAQAACMRRVLDAQTAAASGARG
jgi:glycosyltransferase involved in cell wall biosynthesis